MNNRRMLSGIALLCAALLTQSANAGTGTGSCVREVCPREVRCEPRHKHHYCHDKKHPFFVTVGSGVSWSAGDSVDVDHVTTAVQGGSGDPRNATKFWDGAKEGYDDEHGTSEFYTVALGYHWSDLFSTNVELTHRPSYTYRKTQTQDTTNNINGLEDLGNKTRYFDLKGTSLTFNIDFRSGGLFDWASWECGDHFKFQLILGGGVGISYNRIENFHTIAEGTSGLARFTPDLAGRRPAVAGDVVAERAIDGNTAPDDIPTASPIQPSGAAVGATFNANDQIVLLPERDLEVSGDVVIFKGERVAPAGFQKAHSIMLDRTKTDFVWQVKFGFEVAYRRCSFDIFYRYHDAGKFRSHNYIIDTPVNFLDPVKVPAWSGDMAAHELCFNMNKRF